MAALEPDAPELLTPEAVRQHEPALIALLQDVVDDGASIGFLSPHRGEDFRFPLPFGREDQGEGA